MLPIVWSNHHSHSVQRIAYFVQGRGYGVRGVALGVQCAASSVQCSVDFFSVQPVAQGGVGTALING